MLCGGRDGLVFSAPDSGSRAAVRPLAGTYFVVFLGKTALLPQCLSPPKRIKGCRKLTEKPEKNGGGGGGGGGGGYLRWTSIPSRRSSNTPSRFMLQKPEYKAPAVMSYRNRKT